MITLIIVLKNQCSVCVGALDYERGLIKLVLFMINKSLAIDNIEKVYS
jgi:hypothetical protein